MALSSLALLGGTDIVKAQQGSTGGDARFARSGETLKDAAGDRRAFTHGREESEVTRWSFARRYFRGFSTNTAWTKTSCLRLGFTTLVCEPPQPAIATPRITASAV